MMPRVTPTFFYGCTTAAALGLSLGLLLNGDGWENHPGGPQIWFASAAAEALSRPAQADEPIVAEAAYVDPEPADDPLLYVGYVPQAPLPVVRLAPERFDPPRAPDSAEPQLQPASDDWPERQEADALLTDVGLPSPAVEAIDR